MKNIIYIFLALTSVTFSQTKIERNLGEFSKLAVYDGINVELVKADVNKAEITGKNTKNVVVKNKNGDLKIRLNLEKRFSGDRTKVVLYYKNIYNLITHEGSNVFSKDTIDQADISLKANSGSRQNFLVKLNTLNTTALTGATINISGSVQFHDSSASSGAKIYAEKLNSEEAYVGSSSGGVVSVSAEKELEVNSKLGGIINVHTKTEKITETISLGGVVNYLYED